MLDTMEGLDAALEAELQQEMAAFEWKPLSVGTSDTSAKWRMVSCIQKAVRRGEAPIAAKFAQALVALDEAYFWYRACIIALEDVGAANLNLAAKVLLTSRHKRIREVLGRERVAAYLAGKMAESIKDRNACDLLVCADWTPGYEKRRAYYSDLPPEQLVLIAQSGGDDPIDRTLALWFLAGTDHFTSPVLLPKAGSMHSLLECYKSMGVSALARYCSRWGASKMKEGHPITIGLTSLYAAEGDGTATFDDYPRFPLLGGKGSYISAAFDMHTREGKMAISAFCKSSPALAGFKDKVPDLGKAVGVAIFRLEGHHVNRRLAYPASGLIQEKTTEAFMISSCGSLPLATELFAAVASDLPRLHDLRKWSLGKAGLPTLMDSTALA